MYLCIDLKTFFASVECALRDLDPFNTNLVVADPSRGKGAICLAVTPKMKMLGVKNRCRVFEIPPNIKYIMAKPRMKKYIEYSANIYEVYLEFFAKEDIYVYSIDEVFIDISKYMKLYKLDEVSLAKKIMKRVFDRFKITATAGIGTNMYLAKIALDIMAKHSPSNIGYLTEEMYKEKLWKHKPLNDFWGIGSAIQKRLNKMCIFTMEQLAKCDEKKLYKEFGINAKSLLDHAWGKEECTIYDVKNYIPKSKSISNSQILFSNYPYENAKLVVKEMVCIMSEKLVSQKLNTGSVKLYIGYSKDYIKSTGGSRKLKVPTNSYSMLVQYIINILEETTNKQELIRKVGISFNDLSCENNRQISIWDDDKFLKKENNVEVTICKIKEKFGKNSIIKGMDLQENATTIMRNKLIGGHNE